MVKTYLIISLLTYITFILMMCRVTAVCNRECNTYEKDNLWVLITSIFKVGIVSFIPFVNIVFLFIFAIVLFVHSDYQILKDNLK